MVEHFGQIEATLVNGSSGKTASMVFSDLPVMVSATALPMPPGHHQGRRLCYL